MNGLRAWLGKEWRENRLILGIWLLLSPLMVAVPGWLAGGREGFRFPWEVGVTIFIGLGLLVLLLAVGLFCVERRRDRLDWVRRTPRGLRNAYLAKMILYLTSVALAYVWMAFLAGSFAELLGAYTPKDGNGPLPTFLWLEYPHRELLVVMLGVGLWFVLASIVFGLGAFNMALGAVLMVVFCLPLFWWSAKHPWFLSIEHPGAPWRLGLLMIVLGLGCGAWAWLRATRHANDRKRVLACGLLPILLVFVAGTACGFHALSKYESLDLSLDGVHIGLGGTEGRALTAVDPTSRYLYAYLYRSNQPWDARNPYPRPWPISFARRKDGVGPRSAFDVRATPMRPYRFDLETGAVEAMGEMKEFFHTDLKGLHVSNLVPPEVPRRTLFIGPPRLRDGMPLRRVDTTPGTVHEIELPDGRKERLRIQSDLLREIVQHTSRVRSADGCRAWLWNGRIEREDGLGFDVPDAAQRNQYGLPTSFAQTYEIPGGWLWQPGHTADALDGRVRKTKIDGRLTDPWGYASPGLCLGFVGKSGDSGREYLLHDLDKDSTTRVSSGLGDESGRTKLGHRGTPGELLRFITPSGSAARLETWRPATNEAAVIPIRGMDLSREEGRHVVHRVQYDRHGNALIQIWRQKGGFVDSIWHVLLPANASSGHAIRSGLFGEPTAQLHLLALEESGSALFLESNVGRVRINRVVRYDVTGTRTQLLPRPK